VRCHSAAFTPFAFLSVLLFAPLCSPPQVAPLTLEGVDPAAADLPDVDGVSAASLYPKIDTTRHVIMEIVEPDFTARLAYNHEEKEEWMRRQQAKMATAQASSTVSTSLPDPQTIPANLTA